MCVFCCVFLSLYLYLCLTLSLLHALPPSYVRGVQIYTNIGSAVLRQPSLCDLQGIRAAPDKSERILGPRLDLGPQQYNMLY